MFVLDQGQQKDFDLSKAAEFVECWSQFYIENTKIFNSTERINYLDELNVGHELTPENVKRLLRWKDPHYLTEEVNYGTPNAHRNPKVMSVVSELDSINAFRTDAMTVDEYRSVTGAIFPNGVVWRVLLFHIARPAEYPICDRYVFRTARTWLGLAKPKAGQSWEDYEVYRSLFCKVCLAAGVVQAQPTIQDSRDRATIQRLKKVDNALVMFGRYLDAYCAER